MAQTDPALVFRGICRRSRTSFARLCLACRPNPNWKIPLLAVQLVPAARRAGTGSKERGHSEQRISQCRRRKSARCCQLFPSVWLFQPRTIFSISKSLGGAWRYEICQTAMPLWRSRPTPFCTPGRLKRQFRHKELGVQPLDKDWRRTFAARRNVITAPCRNHGAFHVLGNGEWTFK